MEAATRSLDELSTNYDHLQRDVEVNEAKMREAHSEQARMEAELSTAYSASDKYRQQVVELEKNAREAEKRNREEVGFGCHF